MTVDRSRWKHIGRSGNADFYEVEEQILCVVPFEGCTDDETTARESVRIQHEYLHAREQRGGVIVLMDPVVEQTAGARTVYRDEPDPEFVVCYALVGGTMFGRAIGSIFLGLSRPKVPTRMFATVAEALAFVRAALAEAR